MYGTELNYVLIFSFPNHHKGSGRNNESIGMGSLILKLSKLLPMVADEYMGLATAKRTTVALGKYTEYALLA
ncbi:MAG: hypothetical protein GY853_15190 [PVC group bacterium]|nr:hypothetical protein [PVC group bacterium]